MINKELYITREDGVKLYRSYSSDGFKIRQVETGNVYDAAIDPEDHNFTYEETEELIESEDATEEDYEEALGRLGV